MSEYPNAFKKPDLRPVQRHDAADDHAHEERRDGEEDRRHDHRHALKLVDLGGDETVADLARPVIGAQPAMMVEQPVQRIHHVLGHGLGADPDREVVERALHVEGGGHGGLGHPQDAVALVVGHQRAGPDRVDEFRAQGGARDGQRPALSVEIGVEDIAHDEAVGLGEGGVDHYLVGRGGVGAGAQDRHVQKRRVVHRPGQDLPHGDLLPPGKVEHRRALHPRLGGIDACDVQHVRNQRQRRAARIGEDVGEAVTLVIGVARVGERGVHPEGRQQDRHPAGQHQRDGQPLQPEPSEIAQEFLVERLHARLPRDLVRGGAGLVHLHARDLAIGEEDHAMRHGLDAGIVGDDHGGGAKRVVDLLQDLQHLHPGLRIERARGLVAEQDLGPLGDGPRDRDALLLAARKLCREMVEPVGEAHHLQRLGG
jgi:hypothetical protein